ncbi:probable cytochrome P450 6a13 [Schistocerca nitens]|uniref:probable cytochrome P450 6a13 n=1 Tax=Schistocerca nitens TaxID=7011 RepID=UPI00211911C3|nr:probable cytochrome P450 6a13 [Schistocerca nitens]
MVYESGDNRRLPPFAMAILSHLLLSLTSADVFVGDHSRWWWLAVAATFLAIIAVTSLRRYADDFITKLVRPKPLHEILHVHYEAAPHDPCSWVNLGREKFLLVRDKDLVAQVLSTDFPAFSKRTQMHDYLLGLFGQDGSEWRRARSSLTPSFTPAALRAAAAHVKAHARRLRDVAACAPCLTRRHLLAYCVDCIASSVFALSAEALPTSQAPTTSPFLDAVAHIDQVKRSDGGRVVLQLLGRSLFHALKLAQLPRSVTSFFSTVGQDSFSFRQHNKVSAHDFIKSLMKKMQQEQKREDEICEEVSEQTVAVLSAGSSDTCHVLRHCLAELAALPDIQSQLREQICSGNDAPPLLDEFIAEVLRLHPAEPVLIRECQSACKLGAEQLQPGDNVIVPVWSLHRDTRLSLNDDADLQRGHNFQLGRKQAVQLHFSAGPRMCVGYRLGLLQVRTALTELLSHFELMESDYNVIHLRKIT